MISTPGKRKRCAVKRATSSSVSLVRMGSDSKFFDSSISRLKRRRSRGVMSTSRLSSWMVASRSATLDGVISSV